MSVVANHRFISLVLVTALALVSCSDSGAPLPNERPTVWIVSGPQDGGTTHYRPTIYWDGFDPDGEISYFEYILTDHVNGIDPGVAGSTWKRINTYSREFFVSADIVTNPGAFDPTVLDTLETSRGHTFYVRAIDNVGTRSARAAKRTFISKNLSPVVDLLTPVAAGSDSVVVPPIMTFQWNGTDFIQSVAEVDDPVASRWILLGVDTTGGTYDLALDYIRNNPDAPEWTDWKDYTLVRYYINPDSLAAGPHVFAVQVRDEAGAISESIDLNRNARKLMVQ